MKIYRLEPDNVFIFAHSYTCIQLVEFDPKNPVNVIFSELKLLWHIGENQEYDGLEIFGKVISGQTLKNLAGVLKSSKINVNREGLCYLSVFDSPAEASLGVLWYRLNDVFDWSKYGVKSSVRTIWNRVLIPGGTKTVIDYQDQKKCLEEFQNGLKEKEKMIEDLKHRLSSSEQELKEAVNKFCVAEAELKSTKVELESLQEALEKPSISESELKSVKIQLDSTKVEVAALQTEVKDQVAKAKELQNQLCEKVKDLIKASSELCDTKAEIN